MSTINLLTTILRLLQQEPIFNNDCAFSGIRYYSSMLLLDFSDKQTAIYLDGCMNMKKTSLFIVK